MTGDGWAALNSVFARLYPTGTLHVPTRTELAGGSFSETFANTSIKVQDDVVTEAFRARPGWANAESRLIVLSAGVSAVTTECEITDGRGVRWRLRAADLDPCGSHWDCAGVRA